MWDKEIEHMTTRDIIEHLKKAQRDSVENEDIEEISQSEFDQIFGASSNGDTEFDECAGYSWKKRF